MLDERPAPEDGTADATATADLLRQAGKTLISKVGGASGPLYGTAFLRGAGAIAAATIRRRPRRSSRPSRRPPAASPALGKASEGEKTMLDALFPAARAAREPRSTVAETSRRSPAAARDAAAAGADGDDPDARDEGPRVVPRRAERRSPGPGRDVVGAAARGPRRRRAAAEHLDRPARRPDRTHGAGDARRAPGVAGRRHRAAALGRRRSSPVSAARRRRPSRRTTRPTERARLAGRPRRRGRRADRARRRGGRAGAGDEVGAIFEAQALFASDPGIVDPAMAAIDEGATAEEAIDRVTAAQADALAAVDDEYFRERAADLRDVGRRVVDRLTGPGAAAAPPRRTARRRSSSPTTSTRRSSSRSGPSW